MFANNICKNAPRQAWKTLAVVGGGWGSCCIGKDVPYLIISFLMVGEVDRRTK